MKKNKAFIWLTISMFALSFLLGFFVEYHIPRIENWLLIEVEKQSSEKLPVRVWPKSVHVSLFPPGLVLNEVRLLPQKELLAILAPTTLEEAEVRLNWFHLLTGRIRFSYVGIKGAEIKLILKEVPSAANSTKKDALAKPFRFEQLLEIPVDELNLEKIKVFARLKEEGFALHLPNLSLNIESRGKSFLGNIDSPEAMIKWRGAHDILPLGFSMRALLEEAGLRISALKVKAGTSYLVGAGTIGSELDMQTRTHLNLKDVKNLERVFRSPQLPDLMGELGTELQINGSKDRLKVSGVATGSSIQIANHIVGNFDGNLLWKDGRLNLSQFSLSNSAGRVVIQKLDFQPDKEGPISATVKVEGVEIGQLLKNIGLGKIPLHLNLSATSHCSGQMLQATDLECQAEAKVRDLSLHTGAPENKTIVAINEASAKGKFRINLDGVTYSADLGVGAQSKGKSSGTILYKKGFKIEFEGEKVAFSDLKTLVNLKLEGEAKIKGTTEGDAHVGRVNLLATASKVWLDDYFLGDPQAVVRYRNGQLQFDDVIGQVGSSRYMANIGLNLPKHTISIQGKAPYLDLADLKSVFGRKVTLPFEIAGTGSGEVSAHGPLQFNQLSYTLDSAFYRGAVAGESFDQFQFKLNAQDGLVKSDRVKIVRGQSTIEFNGKINPEAMIDAVVVGRKLRIEESENITRLGFDLTGQLDFTTAITGKLPHPTFDSHGRLSRLVVGDRAADDSTFKLKVTEDRFEGGGSLMGDVVQLDFIVPIQSSAPFRLKAKATRWNFANLFSIFSTSLRQRDFQTALSGTVDLGADQGNYEKLSGTVNIEELRVQRGKTGIANTNPVVIKIANGVASARPFAFEGEGGYVRLSVPELSRAKVNSTINGKLDLSLLTLFAPFFADLQGRLAVNISVSGRGDEPELAGSAYVEQGIVRFKEFPHSFTDLRADVIFSEKGATLNSIKGELGGGRLSGEGRINWQSRNSVPVDVKGRFDGVSLNVPEGFKTKGSGSWSFKGAFFPYTIGVVYDVDGGEVTSDFGGAGLGDKKGITPSALLPKSLTQIKDQPVNLDLQIQIKNPLPIRNEMVNAQVRGKVHVVGPPNQPKLSGVITPIPQGEIYFRDVPFEIQTGYIEYQDDPPENPKLYLTAQTLVAEKVRDEVNPDPAAEKENQYEINLGVQGRAKQPRITLSSMPSLSEKEIVSLLALGMTPKALEQNRTAGQLAASNSVQIGTAILQKPLSKEVRNRLGLDVQISQSGTENTNITKLTINKQFTPKLGASASRTLEKNPSNSVKMEYKFNRNFSVVGSWDGKEGTTQLEEEKDINQSVFGLDLEFKVNFK